MDTSIEPDPVRAYADEAVALLAHVESVEDHLDDLRGGAERSRNAAITDAHNEIGATLKLADIYSNLAIAEALDKIRTTFDPKLRPVIVNISGGSPLTDDDVARIRAAKAEAGLVR